MNTSQVSGGTRGPNGNTRGISVFPNKIYDNTLFPTNVYQCDDTPGQDFTYASRPRDLNIQYIIGRERQEHPQWFTRFGYDYAPNGYGEGVQAIYKYTKSWNCALHPDEETRKTYSFIPKAIDYTYYRENTSQGSRMCEQGKALSTSKAFLTPLDRNATSTALCLGTCE